MQLTLDQIKALESQAISGSHSAIKTLANAARTNASDAQLYKVTTPDGRVEMLTVEQYLELTATDLQHSKIELVAA